MDYGLRTKLITIQIHMTSDKIRIHICVSQQMRLHLEYTYSIFIFDVAYSMMGHPFLFLVTYVISNIWVGLICYDMIFTDIHWYSLIFTDSDFQISEAYDIILHWDTQYIASHADATMPKLYTLTYFLILP